MNDLLIPIFVYHPEFGQWSNKGLINGSHDIFGFTYGFTSFLDFYFYLKFFTAMAKAVTTMLPFKKWGSFQFT